MLIAVRLDAIDRRDAQAGTNRGYTAVDGCLQVHVIAASILDQLASRTIRGEAGEVALVAVVAFCELGDG